MNAIAASKPQNLYEIEAERRALISDIEAAGGEITPEQESGLADLDEALTSKVDAYGWTIDRLTKEADAMRTRAATLAMYAQVRERQVQRLKDRMAEVMRAQGTTTLGGADWTVSLRHSERCIVEVASSNLPVEFQRIEVVADKTKIKAALRTGAVIAGARIETVPFVVLR